MIRRNRWWILMVWMLAAGSPTRADLESGLRAFEAGDYAKAYETLLPLAEHHGYGEAMNNLGVMYQNGWGVQRDGMQAAAWYEKAASSGVSKAMYNLGMLYAEGDAVERDVVKGLAWLGAAYDHREGEASRPARLLASRMSDEQLAAAATLREEISVRLYGDPTQARMKTSQPALTGPPVDVSQLLSSEQIVDLYSGGTSRFEFRDSPVRESFRAHRSRDRALAGKKAKFEGAYRDGYYQGKWWVENDMLCLDYAKIAEFDDCFWLERISDREIRAHSRKTGLTNVDRIEKAP